ncbi:MAG: hypothetical protein ACFE88_07095 [Candidatus Hermodarchaeota archaeon]
MTLFNTRKKRNQKNQWRKVLLCLFFTVIISVNFIQITENYFKSKNSNEILLKNEDNYQDNILNNLKTSTDTSMLQNPFTKNFDLLLEFFESKYQSSLQFNVPTYYRYGDNLGDIIDDTIFSEDNLLFYKSLLTDIGSFETFDTYLKLKETTLWYKGNTNQFEYGFVKSIDNTTGQITDDKRYLVDNLLPIFLLIENIGDEIDDIFINGIYPEDSINEMFNLVNSTEFWDDINKGFYHHNSTTNKNSESNFYAILANLLIHRTGNLDISIRDRAYDLANQTMIALKASMWDTPNKAFYYQANSNWNAAAVIGGTNYHLSTNSLGIFTLLEFWIETGMENDSLFYQNAKDLYESLEFLWNGSLYSNIADPGWGGFFDSSFNLKSNAMMMSACLKLFEVTGNKTYYERALRIFESLELYFYDNNSYKFSSVNSNKNFHSNLKLSEAYLDAFSIYNNTVLIANYNLSNPVPDFIFNQDVMNLTSVYSYKKTSEYFDPESKSYLPFTVQYNITNATINYLFKYPNGTFLKLYKNQINSPAISHTLLYGIEDSLPIGDGYFIYVWANTTYFKMADVLKRFNVVSGLINKTIEGLLSTLYQGPIVNVTLIINYTRSDNLTLTATLEGEDIINFPSQEINFTASQEIRVSFNLTAKFGAIPGPSEIFFKIKQGNVLYLLIKRVIQIGNSFDYSNLIYENKIVRGDKIFVSMNLKNFLPNATQTLNVSFTGIFENSIEDFIKEEILNEQETKTVTYNLKSLESVINDTIKIKMSILINTTEYYSEILTVELLNKFEILSISFPEKIQQGTHAYLVIVIKNNQENSEGFSLQINGKSIRTNIALLTSGENRIVAEIIPSLNPYEFGIKRYRVVLRDSLNEEIARFYFEINLDLSTLNLILFYVLPVVVPIGIILFFKNKDIKHKKLRR